MAETKIGVGTVVALAALVGGGFVLWKATQAKAEDLPLPGEEPPEGSAITALVAPAGSGKVVAHGAVLPQIGDRVTIEAIPNPGWQFDYWEWDNGNTFFQNPFTVIVTREAWIKAHFVPLN